MSDLIKKATTIIDDVTENSIQPPEWQLEQATMEIVAEQIVKTVLEEIILQSNDLERDVSALVNKIAKDESITLFEDVGS